MKRIISIFFAIIPLLLSSQSRTGRDYAFFVGVSDFKNEWQDLPAVQGEIDQIKTELELNYNFTTEVRKNPTRQEFIDLLTSLGKKQFQDGDQLLLFISTHGYANAGGGLVFQDSKTYSTDAAQATLLPYSTLKKLLNNIQCKHILLCIDACFSGTFADISKGDGRPVWENTTSSEVCDKLIKRALNGNSFLFFTSVGENEKSPSESSFALRFLNRLQEPDNDGIISYYELNSKLLLYVKPKPRAGEFAGRHTEGNDFVFIRRNLCANPELAKKGTAATCIPPSIAETQLASPKASPSYSETRKAAFRSVVPRLEGGFAAFGYSETLAGKHSTDPQLSGGGGEDILLLISEGPGKKEQLMTLGGKPDERVLCGIQTLDGAYVMAGYIDGNGPGAAGGKDAYLIKVDGKGKLLWPAPIRIGSKKDDWFNKVVQMDNGMLVACGLKNEHPLIITVDANGNAEELPELSILDDLDEGEINAMTHTPDDQLLLAGMAGTGSEKTLFLTRFDPEEGKGRIGQPYVLKTENKSKYQKSRPVDVLWDSQNLIKLLVEERNAAKQENATILTIEESADHKFKFRTSASFGGAASDYPQALCSDLLGNTYFTGNGHSYSAKGGIKPKQFAGEVRSNGESLKGAWHGDIGSRGYAVAMLPQRGLLVAGQDDKEKAWIQYYELGLPVNDNPRIYLVPNSAQYQDGSGNDKLLSPGERAAYLLRVENKSCEHITNVVVKVQVNGEGVKCPEKIILADIPANSGLSFGLPLVGASALKRGTETQIILSLSLDDNMIGNDSLPLTLHH